MPSYQGGSAANMQSQSVRPTSGTPLAAYAPNSTNSYTRQNSFVAATPVHQSQAQTTQTQAQPYQYTPQQPQTPLAAAHPGAHSSTTAVPAYNRPTSIPVTQNAHNTHQTGTIPQNRSAEAYTLNSAANESIPKEIRDQFPQDDQGHVLFFTSPPLDTQDHHLTISQTALSVPFEHTEPYMKALTVRKRKLDQSQLQSNGDVAMHNLSPQSASKHTHSAKTPRLDVEESGVVPEKTVIQGLSSLKKQVQKATYNEYQSRYGDEWRQTLLADLDYIDRQRKAEARSDLAAQEIRETFKTAHLDKHNGQYALNKQGYLSGWQKDFFTGVYLDDFDSRLP